MAKGRIRAAAPESGNGRELVRHDVVIRSVWILRRRAESAVARIQVAVARKILKILDKRAVEATFRPIFPFAASQAIA